MREKEGRCQSRINFIKVSPYLKLDNGHDDGEDGEEEALKGKADEEDDVDRGRLAQHQARLRVGVRDAASCQEVKRIHWRVSV